LELVEANCGHFHFLFSKFKRYKTDHGIGITCVEEVLMPWEYGMKVTSHQDSISYNK
jgi:hypothetical protein